MGFNVAVFIPAALSNKHIVVLAFDIYLYKPNLKIATLFRSSK
jgi:hypothetical protein